MQTFSPDTDELRLSRFLHMVVAKEEIHGKWLNTLSFLENMGTTKIYKSQSGNHISRLVLQHASEESRHALFFKKLISRVNGNLPTYEKDFLLCPLNSFMYFQRLDAMVNLNLKKDFAEGVSSRSIKKIKLYNNYLKYLYVTLIIEERASFVYAVYEKALNELNADISLKSVILEESGHMDSTVNELRNLDADFDSRMAFFRMKENQYYLKYLSYLEGALKVYESSSP